MTSEKKQEYTLRISQANKTQMIVILYEMLLSYVDDAENAANAEKPAETKEALRRARGCINELMASLNFEYEPAENLLQLYIYVNRELIRAEIKKDMTCLSHIRIVINSLHNAYQQISEADDSQPIMSNTQSVYAGLTYHGAELSENLSNPIENRGFYA